MDPQPTTPVKNGKTPKSSTKSTKVEDKDLELALTVIRHLIKNGGMPTIPWGEIAAELNNAAEADAKAITSGAMSVRWTRFKERHGLNNVEVAATTSEGLATAEKKRKAKKQDGPAKGRKQVKSATVLGPEKDMSFEDAVAGRKGSDNHDAFSFGENSEEF